MSTVQDPISILSRIVAAQDSLSVAWKSQNSVDIDISVNKWEALVRQITPTYERYHDILASYATTLLLRWRKRHRAEDIEAAITLLEKVIARSNKDTPSLAQYECYTNLGAAYMDRWETLRRQPQDLVNALDRWESAYSISIQLGRDVESASAILPHLGDAYCFAHAKDLLGYSALQAAIDYLKISLSHAGPSVRSSLNYKIGKAYAASYLELGGQDDLQSAILHLQKATSGRLSPEEMEDLMLELSHAYMKQYENNSSKGPLESAIYWARRAVHVRHQSGDHQILQKVASLLTILYKSFNDQTALDSAIICYEQVWDSHIHQSAEDVATFYYSFGTALTNRSKISTNSTDQNLRDLSRGIKLMTMAVENAKTADVGSYKAQLMIAKERWTDRRQREYSELSEPDFLSLPQLPNPRPLRSSTVPFAQKPFPTSNSTSRKQELDVFNANKSEFLAPPPRQFSAPSRFTMGEDPVWHSDTPDIQVWASYPIEAEPLPIAVNATRPMPPRDPGVSARLTIPARMTPISPRRTIVDASILSSTDQEEAEAIALPTQSSIKPTNLSGRVIKTAMEPLAEGGFSAIYIGTFGSTKVAIKMIKRLNGIDLSTLKRRLGREMDVWWKLDHPNIVPLWGYTEDMGSLPSMIAPWYENGNASNYIQRAGLGMEFRLQLLREVSSGLRYLHQQSPAIVHGDLKPGNVLIDNEGVARLCDFGLAYLVAADADSSASGANVGTIRYAAPELRCPADDDVIVHANASTDIYSLACIGYEFLYKKQPFAEKVSIQAVIAAGYSHTPPARRANEDSSLLGPTAPHYWDLFESCWDEDSSKRPDVVAFCQEIDLAFQALAFAS